jgi:hypothetical protein
MEEGEKKPDAGTISGGPQKKIVYAVSAVAVVILVVVLVAKFGYNTDLLNPAGGQMSLVHRLPTLAYPNSSIRPITTGIVRVPICAINQSDCNGACVYLMTDSGNCGTCGSSCSGGFSCKNGNCISDPCYGVVCSAGNSCCDGRCVNTTAPNNCVDNSHATEQIHVSWENHSIEL